MIDFPWIFLPAELSPNVAFPLARARFPETLHRFLSRPEKGEEYFEPTTTYKVPPRLFRRAIFCLKRKVFSRNSI